MITKLIKNLIHFEGGKNGLDQGRRTGDIHFTHDS